MLSVWPMQSAACCINRMLRNGTKVDLDLLRPSRGQLCLVAFHYSLMTVMMKIQDSFVTDGGLHSGSFYTEYLHPLQEKLRTFETMMTVMRRMIRMVIMKMVTSFQKNAHTVFTQMSKSGHFNSCSVMRWGFHASSQFVKSAVAFFKLWTSQLGVK